LEHLAHLHETVTFRGTNQHMPSANPAAIKSQTVVNAICPKAT
jgi:hypothetical protein